METGTAKSRDEIGSSRRKFEFLKAESFRGKIDIALCGCAFLLNPRPADARDKSRATLL
jgi:hypothetical protein